MGQALSASVADIRLSMNRPCSDSVAGNGPEARVSIKSAGNSDAVRPLRMAGQGGFLLSTPAAFDIPVRHL
jgi:hypothetical protein